MVSAVSINDDDDHLTAGNVWFADVHTTWWIAVMLTVKCAHWDNAHLLIVKVILDTTHKTIHWVYP